MAVAEASVFDTAGVADVRTVVGDGIVGVVVADGVVVGQTTGGTVTVAAG